MADEHAILSSEPLGFPWACDDPFLFCVYHQDRFPAGNPGLGPAATLAGRHLGSDFDNKDGWNMYHGESVPGFPAHPHRGFETVTYVRKGLVDHADSLGAAARYGEGDAQWLTTGKGIVHSEMFPLVHRDAPNPAELFQIWLNLPPEGKLAAPHFAMLWGERIPKIKQGGAEITLVAGALGGQTPPPPPPDSWAARADAGLAIWTIHLNPGASFTLPPAAPGLNRSLYYFKGAWAQLSGREAVAGTKIRLRSDASVEMNNGASESEFLLLQGRPIGAPVASQGPFVMNSPAELRAAFDDYRRDQFGGWPWPIPDPVHPAGQGRFAKHPGGRSETP